MSKHVSPEHHVITILVLLINVFIGHFETVKGFFFVFCFN